MPGGKRGANTWYDDDDLYDEDEYDDEEAEAYQAPVKLPQHARSAPVCGRRARLSPAALLQANMILKHGAGAGGQAASGIVPCQGAAQPRTASCCSSKRC